MIIYHWSTFICRKYQSLVLYVGPSGNIEKIEPVPNRRLKHTKYKIGFITSTSSFLLVRELSLRLSLFIFHVHLGNIDAGNDGLLPSQTKRPAFVYHLGRHLGRHLGLFF